MCKLGSVDFCYPLPNRPAAGNGERHQDLGDEVADEMERRSAARRMPAISAFDCTASFCGKPLMSISSTWDSETAGLQRLQVTHPRTSRSETQLSRAPAGAFLRWQSLHSQMAHSFEVTGNLWKQSPSSYRQSSRSCESATTGIALRASMTISRGAFRIITSGVR